MSSGDVWILGIRMTKFGKRPDDDTMDLAAEAGWAVASMRDDWRTIFS